MVKKKIDNRIRILIENGLKTFHRSLIVVVGDKGRDQVVILHHMLSKAQIKARPTVLWCYKKELDFSTHRKKRMKQMRKRQQATGSTGTGGGDEDNPFEVFLSSTQIHYTFYSDTPKILGRTFGMCVLQDFEALTPNLLARTIETVEGGGLVVLLLQTMRSLKQLYALSMDVHSRYRTEMHRQTEPRFNERFILSLSSCKQCLIVDDQLNVLPCSSEASLNIQTIASKTEEASLTHEQIELKKLCNSLKETQPIGHLIECCKTLDQGKVLLKLLDSITDKAFRHTCSITASRGRGKSAALGLAVAGAIAFGYSNIYVTSPAPENLKILFEFILKGFNTLEYQDHMDYDIQYSSNDHKEKNVVQLTIHRPKQHRQVIQYIQPNESTRLSQCELLIIDEAAAIPLPLVKQLLTGANYLVFLSSTINGYEGTGRSLSLKLLEQLRKQSAILTTAAKTTTNNRTLSELELNEPIRYGIDDPVETWLNNVLCLDCCQDPSRFNKANRGACPSLESCSLYCISRDTLFSYNESSEIFLRRLMYLFVSSHYKNSPNDLQMLSDAPGHDIYCLVGPIVDANKLPEILCAIQVCYEGELSKDVVARQLIHGQRGSGDLIPWTIAQTYQDYTFGKMSGVRIVRLATHPDYQRMGYGTKALQLLEKYFQGNIVNIDEFNNSESPSSPTADQMEVIDDDDLPLLNETLHPRQGLPPLLQKLNERRLRHSIDYLGVSYGLSADLLKFWKKNHFLPIYLRQTASDLTGEYSCIMLKAIHAASEAPWLFSYYQDFRRRLLSLLGFQFRTFTPGMVLNLIQQAVYPETKEDFTASLIEQNFTDYDLRRLESYTRNLVDYHLILDLVPILAKLFYLNRLPIQLTVVQMALLSGIGFQYKTIEQLESELNLPQSQLLALFNKLVKKIIDLINSTQESEIGKTFVNSLDTANMQPLEKSLRQELNEVAATIRSRQTEELDRLMHDQKLLKYSVNGSEDAWKEELKNVSEPGVISIPRVLNKRKDVEAPSHFDVPKNKSKKKKMKNK
ncbi:unnamed protein product [Rotaria socialis]|uniref:RNA cytidine acetyltransferase n=1 Tax=Rotaria socialis TaxID=392032 RepID=A0A818AWE4_9BILA|nr:unnamed protein product [Rotaria socialis]CAF3398046.1 unnamed protein product [Rotaria socialis]CAF3411200.1 unnamed protein product [Rotaria socialis]